jgi:twinkle protein
MTNHLALQSTKTAATSTNATIAGLAAEAIEILEARLLNIEFLSKLGWRSSSKVTAGEVTIEIPYYRDGIEVNTKTRTIKGDKKFFQAKDAVKCFYNEEAIADWQKSGGQLLICEGEMDCAVALQNGYLAVSVPDGAPATQVSDGSVKYSYLEGFPVTGEVIICADGDAAGANLLHDLGLRLGKHRCKWIKYPVGCKDLNEVLVKYGKRGVEKTINRAEWLKVDGVYRMGDLPPLAVPDSKSCEIFPINIRKGDFSVWTGIPSHGKSTLTNHISYVLARGGWNIGVASFEQSPQNQHRYALRTLFCDMAASKVNHEDISNADRWINERYSLIVPDVDSDEDASLGWLLEKMAAAVMRHNVDVFIIDPWNEVEHSFDRREMSQTDYTGFAIKQLKKFARRYNVHVAVVAHPAKLQRNKDGEYPIPTLYDVADSAHWANKADLGVIVHRQQNNTLVRVQKSRYHKDIGLPDDYILDYDTETMRFSKAGAIFSQYGG